MKTTLKAAISVVLLMCAFAGQAAAQMQPKLIREGVPGRIVRVSGDSPIVVMAKADCPAWSLVDGICFADVIVEMQQTGQDVLRTFGANSTDETLAAQQLALLGQVYDVKKQGEAYMVNKVGPLDVTIPRRCGRLQGQNIQVQFDTSSPKKTLYSTIVVVCDGGAPLSNASLEPTLDLPGLPVIPGAQAKLGEPGIPSLQAPIAGAALSIYEFYGDETLVVYPQNGCAPEHRLFDGACFSSVMGHMQANGYTDMNVIKTDANYRVGSQLSFSGPADVIKVLTGGDYTSWKARHAVTFDAGVRYPNGCTRYPDYDPNREGVVIVRSNVAQFFTRMACPPLSYR